MIWDEPPVDIEANAKKLMEKIEENVKGEPGWSAIGVFPEPPDHPNPFTYTIGLMENFDHPELIIYGCKAGLAHSLIACAVDLIKKGVKLEPGRLYGEIMANYDMRIEAHPPGPPLNWASHYYGKPAEAVQMVWPDAEGIFPDEEGFDENFVGHQIQDTEEP